MKRALERQEAGEAQVIPILVRPVDWKGAPFAHLQALPTGAKPIASWSDSDSALADVAEGIRHAIEQMPLRPNILPVHKQAVSKEGNGHDEVDPPSQPEVQGLETGEADRNFDERVTLDEWYDYVYEQVTKETSKQTPGKWANQQGTIPPIAKSPRPPVPIPPLAVQPVGKLSSIWRRRSVVSMIVIVLLLLLTTGVADWFLSRPSQTYVTTVNDAGSGSLRQAIAVASPGSTITFDTSLRGTILLTSSDLNIAKDLTIRGPGAGMLAISSGKSGHRVRVVQDVSATISGLAFKDSYLSNGFIYNEGTLTLSNSSISGNSSTNLYASGGGGSDGGSIYNKGALTLNNSTVSGNTADFDGGGIYNSNLSTLTLNNSSVSGNSAQLGGGIYNSNLSTLTLNNSTVSDNSAQGGGGIYNNGTLTLNNSTVSGNRVVYGATGLGDGGGIDSNGTLTLINSIVSGNMAFYGGGGIYDGGELTVVNSTLSNNVARGSSSFGGGIYYLGLNSAIVRFCTIYGNTSYAGGGIRVDPTGSSHMTISSSIIAANNAQDGPDISGLLISGGYNLLQTFAGATGLNATTDKQVTLADLKLDPMLGNNGGHTQTLALHPGSSAIDVIPLQACSITLIDAFGDALTIATDQRGDSRPDGSENICDVGAYESSH